MELVGPGRVCQAYVPVDEKRPLLPTACGFNQSHIDGGMILDGQGTDLASLDKTKYTFTDESGGTYYCGETAVTTEWIRVGIDGLMWMGSCPGSHPTAARSIWTTIGSLALNDVPGLPGGVIGRDSNASPDWNTIGSTAFYNMQVGSLTRTEPWWLTKGCFMPRMSLDSLFNTT